MSKSRQQKVKNGKRRIERRLRRKNWSQQDEPMFKANNIHYELSERTRGIGVGGIGAVHKSTTTRIAGGLMKAPRRGRSAPEYNRRNVAGSTPDLSLPTVRNPPEPFLAASSPIPSVKS